MKKEIYPIVYTRDPHVDEEMYTRLYKESIEDSKGFWSAKASEFLTWFKKPTVASSGSFEEGNVKWFEDGELNVSYNCIDRHIESGNGDRTAIIWEGNDGETTKITYRELLENVSRLANVLTARGITKGDRVCIYMPMILEATYAMLACARIGAVHTVVFGGFSAASLMSRINDAQCGAIITADYSKRGEKSISLIQEVTSALSECPSIHTALVVRTTDEALPSAPEYIDYREEIEKVESVCEPVRMNAEDPLFILYTSGSTGKPKGVLHTTGGYLLYASMTHKYVFDYQEGDVYWCAADVGWITGHSYIVYGPLCNGATTVQFEGVPTYPSPSRYWEIIDKHSVTTFYSTPTALRMLMAFGDEHVTKTSRKSLRVLGSVGEPINPEAWRWYYEVVGEEKSPIMDTWWQTETGGFAIAPMPGARALKPGSATKPFFGITPVIVDDAGAVLEGEAEGKLMLKGSWPGMMRDLYNDHDRYMETYFSACPGLYATGDGAKRDSDGYIWITGRIDDVMNVSGHLLGTAEIESALVLHSDVAEAGVVAKNDPVKGSSVCAFVIVNNGVTTSDDLKAALTEMIKLEVGSFAKPDRILFVSGLPKTRSGKIMRRILKKIADGETDEFGDISTLAEPEVVTAIISEIKAAD